MKLPFASCTLVLAPLLLLATSVEAGTLKGKLFEKGTKRPLEDAPIFLLPEKKKAVTDTSGGFTFEGVSEGDHEIVINQSGYLKLSEFVTVPEGETSKDFFLEKETYTDKESVYETTITDSELRRDGAKRTMSAKKAVSLPGSGNDAIRAIQNLPGVARVPGLSSQIVIQGSAPTDTRYTIDGHEVPIIFHFGGFSSVIQPEALDHIDYLSAGYGPDFGRAQGGLIGAYTKKPDADRVKGFAFVDLLNAGGALETPLDDKSSLYVGLRKSYIGAILKAAAKENDDFNLTAAPSFDDASLIYQRRLSDKDEFKFLAIGSKDTLEFLLEDPVNSDPTLRGSFYNRTAFIRFIPQWTRKHGDGAITRASLGFGRDWVKFVLGSDFFDLRNDVITVRAEREQDLSPTWKGIVGMDHQLSWTDLTLRLPDYYEQGDVNNPLSSGATRELRIRSAQSHNLGGYAQAIYSGFERWTIKPGVRLDYFRSTKEFFAAPRMAVRRQLTDSLALRSASGMFYQPARPQESSPEAGNPNIESPRAFHIAAGIEKDFRNGSVDGLTLTTGPFYRRFSKIVTQSTELVARDGNLQPERFNNSGSGESYGLEVYLQGNYAPYTFTTSYTLSRSIRREPGLGRYPSQYDQTHNLNLIAARELPRNWKVSTRFRYVTGNPNTPVTGSVFDSDNGVFIPVRGPLYSDRVDAFWQLDLRFDKRWIYKTWILSAYFDIQNLTNHRNVEAVQYAYDYRAREDVKGLPILPILGFKGEF